MADNKTPKVDNREAPRLRLHLAEDASPGARIKVVGVGGGGSNAGNRMVRTGRGGGPGRGAAPVIASLASELGALTIAVVTKPSKFEGKKRQMQAERGIEELRECVDTVITIPNERLLATIARTTSLTDAFTSADDVLRQGHHGT